MGATSVGLAYYAHRKSWIGIEGELVRNRMFGRFIL